MKIIYPILNSWLVPENDETILFDDKGLLIDPEEQKYYSVTGELYGIREVDANRSIEYIKESFKKQELTKITGFVLKDDKKETIDYYKKNFKEYINKDTVFYTAGDKNLKEKLTKLKEETIEREAGNELVSGYFNLAEKGLKGDELYDGLIPSVIKRDYEVNLDIFNNKNDLDKFLNLPDIKDDEDQESKNYLTKLSVPKEKRTELSNAVQNLLHNQKDLFKHTNINRVELLKSIHDVIVNNNREKSKLIKVTAEKNLYDIIKDGSDETKLKKIDTPSFKKAYKKNEDYNNLFNEKERKIWIDKQIADKNISNESTDNIEKFLSNINVPEDKRSTFSIAVQNAFDDYREIAQSTGMKPEELLNAVNEIAVKNGDRDFYQNKRVFFRERSGEHY